MADISQIKLLDGNTYNLKDITARSNKVDKVGDTMSGNLIVPAVRVANTYYGISFDRTTSTPVETILYTGIKWVSGSHMPVVHITGYAYGLQSPVEFKIGFYIYGGKIGYCGVTNMGSWNPAVYLFKYTNQSVEYVAIGLSGSCYFLQLSADVQDEMGKFASIVTDSSAWTWAFLTSAGTIPAVDDGTTCVQVGYKADILNPAKVNGHTVNSDVPANAKFTDTHRPIQVNETQVLGDNTTALNLKAGSNVSLTNSSGTVTIAATDTTYSNKAAASGGTDVSLVTTGEKYAWNSKTSNTGTVTKVSTGVGLTGGDITGTGTIKAKLKSETASTLDSAAMGSTASRQYAVGVDKSGYLSVNIPWNDNTDVNVTNTLGTTTKYYVTGTTSSTTNTGTQIFDTGIYATTTSGQLNATSFKINEKVTLQFNPSTNALDFIFS